MTGCLYVIIDTRRLRGLRKSMAVQCVFFVVDNVVGVLVTACCAEVAALRVKEEVTAL